MTSNSLTFANIGDLYHLDQYQVPTLDEEIALFQRVYDGRNAAMRLAECDDCTDDLMQIIRDGESAAAELVIRNMRLVLSVAYRYRRYEPLGDLIQEGGMGLMRAVKAFDLTRGLRFSTYATYWVHQSISRYISNYGHIIRLPVHCFGSMRELDRSENALALILGREPTDDDLVWHGWDRIKLQQTRHAQRMAVGVISAEKPVSHDSNTTILDLVPANDVSLDEQASLAEIQHCVRKAVKMLPEREQLALVLRFGFDGQPRTLEEVGVHLGLTRERARQIIVIATKKGYPDCSEYGATRRVPLQAAAPVLIAQARSPRVRSNQQ